MIKRLVALLLIAFAAAAAATAANPELVSGNLKLTVYSDTGSFTLYRLSPIGKNRYEPLFDDRNNSSTSWFSVSSNGRIFNLIPRAGRKPEIIADSSTIRVVFTPSDDFQVTQTYYFTGQGSAETLTLAIDTNIENTSGKTADFALKALFDTNLGENAGIHFKTGIRDRISAETGIETAITKDAWIASAGKESSLLFGYTSWNPMPETVIIANWERLKTLSWKPGVVEGRSFNTLYSVNDSALLFIWPAKTLAANKTLTVMMTLGDQAKGAETTASTTVPDQVIAPIIDRSGTRNEVIERILARISEIEHNPGNASDSELIELNALLDKYLTETGAQ